jgi:hypothetical protein
VAVFVKETAELNSVKKKVASVSVTKENRAQAQAHARACTQANVVVTEKNK